MDKQSFIEKLSFEENLKEVRGIIYLATWRRRTFQVEGTAACETVKRQEFWYVQ